MNLYFKYLIALFYLLCSYSDLYSQLYNTSHRINTIFQNSNTKSTCFPHGVDNYISLMNKENKTGKQFFSSEFSPSMVHKTPEPGQYLRIMIIYAKFPDDNVTGDQMNGYSVWHDPGMQRPLNPHIKGGRFIDSVEGDTSVNYTERYRQYTISDYFSELSLGTFDVIGDEYHIRFPEQAAWYKERGYNYENMNEFAIKIADTTYNIDFTRYNNWTFSPDGWSWMPGGGDNSADMIVVVYRRVPLYPEDDWFFQLGYPISGLSDLGITSFFTLDSTRIYGGSGVTCLSIMQNYSKMTQIILHEMTHRYTPQHFEIGLMTGVEHSCFAYSPFERTSFEYTVPVEIPFPYTQQSAEFTLRDYVFTGDLLSVQLNENGEKYFIANHQKLSVYDGISRGGRNCWNINAAQQDPYCPDGKGLYVYHQMNRAECNNYRDVMLVQPEGRHNWYIERMVPYFIPGYSFEIPLFETVTRNPLGLSEFHQPLGEFLTNMQEVTDDPCSDKPNDYFVTIDWLGDGKDAFNIGYDEILSPYSNPQTITCDGSRTGLTVKLLSRDSVSGNINIKVYFDDALALQELPPSKPKNLKVTKNIIEPGTGKFNPVLRWDSNIEPDFLGSGSSRGSYNVYRSIVNNCSPDTASEFLLIGTVTPDSGYYIDAETSLYPEGSGATGCTGLFRSVMYKVEAVDITSLASLPSERALINGYSAPCDDSIETAININQIPMQYSIYNYPNPFNPSTSIKFSLPKASVVDLKIYNIAGQEITTALKNEFKPAGFYSFHFEGANLPSGVYFYVFTAGSYYKTGKMVLIK